MRTIKFRGQKISNGVWVYGSLVSSDALNTAIYYQVGNGSIKQMEWVYVNPDTVGQFTGLYDKTGEEVYEGDILLWTRKNVHIEGRPLRDFAERCKIFYDDDKCAFRFRCKLDCGSCSGLLDFSDDRADASYIEIIGNIHDNPELLEGGNDESK